MAVWIIVFLIGGIVLGAAGEQVRFEHSAGYRRRRGYGTYYDGRENGGAYLRRLLVETTLVILIAAAFFALI